MTKQYISWRRVSTKVQGDSQLGLESQKAIIDYYIGDNELIADYSETYTGKDLNGCIELNKAIAHCKKSGATLIIAKTDRFRNVIEALQIVKQLPNQILFCNLPNSDEFTLTLFFALAELEAKNVSIRTKAALKAKKERDGSWTNEYGKSTGTTRQESIKKATAVSVKNRTNRASKNASNVRFWGFIQQFKVNYQLNSKDDYILLTNQLNKIGLTTATGKEFNPVRARAMYSKCKNLYMYN